MTEANSPAASKDDQLKSVVARRTDLAKWQTSDQFVAKVEELAQETHSSDLFNNPAVGFLLDAIPIAEFTKFRSPQSVRLATAGEQWPDGQIKTSDETVGIEVTEILEEGRRRGDEYRHGGEPKSGDVEVWRQRADAIPSRLEHGLTRKSVKRNLKKCILLVYLNMSTFGVKRSETEAAILALKTKYADHFREICVLWDDRLL